MSRRRMTAIGLALLCLLQLLCLWRAPAVFYPAAVSVALARGQSVTLGRAELAAPQAAARHLRLRRDAGGNWWVRNISAGRQVTLVHGDVARRMGSAPLHAGQWFQIGASRFVVGTADDRGVAFTGAGHRWNYDGALLRRDGSALPACPGTGIAKRILALWNRAAPHALSLAAPLAFGGNLHCGNRLGVPALAGGSAVLARIDGRLLLSNAGGSESQTPLLLAAGSEGADLAQREERLQGVTTMVAGRTRLSLSLAGDKLVLRPRGQVALFTEQQVRLPAQVSWEWQRRGMWSVPAGAAWWLVCALCMLLAAVHARAWLRGSWPHRRGASAMLPLAASGTALIAVFGVGALLLQKSGASVGAGISLLLSWAALWSFLTVDRKPALATCAAVLLLAAGLLSQLELGLGAMEASWLRHFQKTVALLAIGLGMGAWLRLRLAGAATQPSQTSLEWILAALAAAAIGALALQVMFGNETGVFDLQPVEFAKLALAALTAHCIAIGLGWHQALPHPASALVRWLRLAAPALLFVALLAVALLQVDDYSPLLLLLVWGAAMALAWSLAARHLPVAGALAVAAAAGIAVIVWMRMSAGDPMDQDGLYGDRFAVWLDPARHPHTGQQMLLAARAIADGAWWGAGNWLGIGALGDSAGAALAIPAVQDDFAPAFFIHRHGLIGALALWMLQALFVAGLLQTAGRAYQASLAARDFRQAWLWRFRCFVLCGGAAFVAGHLLLSWGTNLAIFPIMGQPMSFLSAGGSHLLFFICPLLAFHAVSAQSIEENSSCRSTSNTRSWGKSTTYSMPKASGRRPGWRCSRAARFCATCWSALRASFAGARRRAAFRM
ncbi:FtsW/RodA/SpoVE family cell cycle protein [Massilia sp. PAMC28688]|nr:FtsW/RodA/SpoVE family cell cycle protein [Massilia sp. PAMC28688]